MNIKNFITKQYNIGPHIGAYIALYTRTSIFIGIISLAMLAGTFWSVGAREYIQLVFPGFAFWMFLVLLAVILNIGMILVWKFVEPSIMSHMNKQGWIHNNPSKAEFEALRNYLDKRFDEIESKLGGDNV